MIKDILISNLKFVPKQNLEAIKNNDIIIAQGDDDKSKDIARVPR